MIERDLIFEFSVSLPKRAILKGANAVDVWVLCVLASESTFRCAKVVAMSEETKRRNCLLLRH